MILFGFFLRHTLDDLLQDIDLQSLLIFPKQQHDAIQFVLAFDRLTCHSMIQLLRLKNYKRFDLTACFLILGLALVYLIKLLC
jgi:hypothetical protein